MSSNDFDNIDTTSIGHDHQDIPEHDEQAGYVEDDDEPKPPRRKKPSSGGSGIMRTVVPVVAIVGVLGAGWFGWNYYSSTYMTQAPAPHKKAFPVRKPLAPPANDSAQNADNGMVPPPHANNAFNLGPNGQNANPNMNQPRQDNGLNIPQPNRQANNVAGPQGDGAPLSLPMNDGGPSPIHTTGGGPNLTGGDLTSPPNDAPPPGFPASAPLKAPTAPPAVEAPAASQGMADIFDSKMADFLSDAKEGREDIKKTVTDSADNTVQKIDAKVDELGQKMSQQLTELNQKADELSKQVDAMSKPVLDAKAKEHASTGGIHRPKTKVYKSKAVKPKKMTASEPVMNNGSWHLRGVSREIIVLQDPKGNYMPVKIGSNIAGLGTIEGVQQTEGGKYIVKTSTSTIQE